GSIMYAVRCTIPDVAFAQNIPSRFQQNPGESHWTAGKTTLKRSRLEKLQAKYYYNVRYIAEYIAASESAMEAIWIKKFISGLVHTDGNIADPFTKALPKGKLTQHARSMGLCLASSFM
ncbi:hypothetical protein Tco_1392738, partial [Tanacetum coccineum]